MTALLAAIGRNARWFLAIGTVAALFLDPLSKLLRPVLPALVVALYALAVMRIDPRAVLRDALRPAVAARNLAICAAMMAIAPVVVFGLAVGLGLPDESVEGLVYFSIAPSIASAAALCFLLGADAALALQLTVLSGLLAPLIGPAMAALLLGAQVPIDALALGARLAALIGAGVAVALLLRRLLTPARIAANAVVLDGVAALTLVTFLIPLFDGVLALILERPVFALWTLALVFVANFGLQLAGAYAARARLGAARAGAVGVLMGNRNVALYVAALPPDPAFTLFVALYQYPMYFTPLVMGRLLPRPVPPAGDEDAAADRDQPS